MVGTQIGNARTWLRVLKMGGGLLSMWDYMILGVMTLGRSALMRFNSGTILLSLTRLLGRTGIGY